jgi:FKBP-type peptidyl-prolyl cis-trans isomerase
VVKVRYEGRLIDGTVFDSSENTGGSIEFGVTEVIPGWTEALLMMKPGDTWELFIPADLAYGEAGRPGTIAPNSTLVFEVELLEIVR